MWRYLYVLFVYFGVCQLYACHDDESVEWIKTQEGTTINVLRDGVQQVNFNTLITYNSYRYPSAYSVDTAYGGRLSVETKPHWVRLRLTHDFGDLRKGEYYAQLLTYSTTIKSIVGYNLFTPYFNLLELPHYGIKPDVFNGVSPSRDDTLVAGCRVYYYQDSVVARTILIHLGYDDQLRPIKRYFPCAPDSLIWYTIKDSVDWEI